jgi:putative DNA primase/helicase
LLSITGEDAITVGRKYKSAWTGRLDTRFLILTNEMPRVADASGALASRFIVLALEQSFYGREDPGLTGRLLPELPGILNWAIAGWRRLRDRGYFEQPASARDKVEEMEELGSPVMAFVREHCEVGPGHSVTVDDLFMRWEAWCADQRRDRPGDKASFGTRLNAAVGGLRMVRLRDKDGSRPRAYEGIGLCTAQDASGKVADGTLFNGGPAI